METIFDHNPRNEELIELFSFDSVSNSMAYGFSIIPLPNENYKQKTTNEEKLLDLALLFELRGDEKTAKKYWSRIPDIERQYKAGFDFLSIQE